MKVLFIVSRLGSANGICAYNVASFLAERGIDVRFLAQDHMKTRKPVDGTGRIEVITVTPSIYLRLKNEFSALNGRIGTWICSLLDLLDRVWVLLCYPCWPLKAPALAKRFAAKAVELVEREAIDIVIPVYTSIEMLIAGNMVKQKCSGVKLIPYFLDALSAGQKPRFMSQQTKLKKALRWEKKLLSNADGIVMMAAAKKSYDVIDQNLEYLDRTVFLDIPMLNCRESVKSTRSRKYFPENEKVFFFAGAMARNIRDPQKLLELFRSAEAPNWGLYLAGSSDYMHIIDEAVKNDPRIRFLGRLPHSQVEEMMEEADFLINIGNTLSYMVPSKIFEYMAFNKPLVSTYKISDDPCLPYLNLYKKAVLIDERNEIGASVEQLQRFVNEMQADDSESTSVSGLVQPGGPLYNNTPAAFAQYLEQHQKVGIEKAEQNC